MWAHDVNKLRTANAAKEEMAAQVPASLKAISSYLKTALEYDKRDPVVAYYCKYALKCSHAILQGMPVRLCGKVFSRESYKTFTSQGR